METSNIDQRFSRQSFEGAAHPEVLASELAVLLTNWFRHTRYPAEGVHEIVQRLRELGHPLCNWDESTDWATWGDDYVHPGTHRLIVEFGFPDDAGADGRSVTVEYSPWPKAIPEREKHCPGCGALMSRGLLQIEAVGHGSAVAPAVTLSVELSEMPREEVLVGARSFQLVRRGWACPSCKGAWLPGTARYEIS